MNATISVVVTTHNSPDYLTVCLESLTAQTDTLFDVIVAEDGIFDETKKVVAQFKDKLSIQHVWQENIGFRAARVRNLGLQKSKAAYVVFLDGDCFVLPDFIAKHRALATQGCFVSGKRSYLRTRLSQTILSAKLPPSSSRFHWLIRAIKNQCTRFAELIPLPDGSWRMKKSYDWKKVQTCNLGVWRSDIDQINGFDSRFVGHGLEDSDFVVRLIKAHVKRKLGDHSSPVFHLEHARRVATGESPNTRLFQETLARLSPEAPDGLKQLVA